MYDEGDADRLSCAEAPERSNLPAFEDAPLVGPRRSRTLLVLGNLGLALVIGRRRRWLLGTLRGSGLLDTGRSLDCPLLCRTGRRWLLCIRGGSDCMLLAIGGRRRGLRPPARGLRRGLLLATGRRRHCRLSATRARRSAAVHRDRAYRAAARRGQTAPPAFVRQGQA